MTIDTASKQWASRPDDQRFLSLDELKTSVRSRRQESYTIETDADQLRVSVADGLALEVPDRTTGRTRTLEPTHWAFSQLAAYAQAPASYLRKLPPELAGINVQWGLEHGAVRDKALILGHENGAQHLRAMTSPSYGRIWDEQVVAAVEQANADGRWKVPAASYATQNPRRATTLYASDRDVFLFLVDEERPIEVGGDTLFRGFYTWNSEVGAATFGLTTFLYRYVCDNRIIWDASDVHELRIRHTGGAPDRFAYEGAQYLNQYADMSTERTVETIKAAQQFEAPAQDKEDGGWAGWLRSRGFSAKQVKDGIETAMAEEGEARSLWDIVNGLTASARKLTNTDERVQVETAAGNLLRQVAR